MPAGDISILLSAQNKATKAISSFKTEIADLGWTMQALPGQTREANAELQEMGDIFDELGEKSQRNQERLQQQFSKIKANATAMATAVAGSITSFMDGLQNIARQQTQAAIENIRRLEREAIESRKRAFDFDLSKVRVFGDPKAELDEMKRQLSEFSKARREAVGKVTNQRDNVFGWRGTTDTQIAKLKAFRASVVDIDKSIDKLKKNIELGELKLKFESDKKAEQDAVKARDDLQKRIDDKAKEGAAIVKQRQQEEFELLKQQKQLKERMFRDRQKQAREEQKAVARVGKLQEKLDEEREKRSRRILKNLTGRTNDNRGLESRSLTNSGQTRSPLERQLQKSDRQIALQEQLNEAVNKLNTTSNKIAKNTERQTKLVGV